MNPSTTSGRAALRRGDPLADAALDALLTRTEGRPPGDLLAAVEAEAKAGDRACRAFVDAVSELPSWVEPALIEHGRTLALSLALPTGVVLLLGGLTEVYAVPAVARVLTATGRLKTMTWRRMLETGRFIRDVHGRGGMRAGGDGFRAVVRVRLIHAMVRRRLGAAVPDEVLIDQPEMAFTLCAHSHVVRRGLATLGFRLTDHEQRAHQHLWRLVGHLMGIDPERLAPDPAAEAKLYRRLRESLHEGDQSRARDLVHHSVGSVAAEAHLPPTLVGTMVHRLVGSPLAEQLEVPTRRSWDRVLGGLVGVTRVFDAGRRLLPAFTRALAALGHTFADLVVAADPGIAEPTAVATARDCARLRPEAMNR
ncbi:MAG: oxygenase MpaB family protein [Myxococcota bacterium]